METGPLLIVANHPNVLLDGLVVLSIFKRKLWFLAKGTLFQNSLVARFLKLLHLIPVYRSQDNPRELIKNQFVFEKVCEHLRQNHAVLIFPEGKSLATRKILEIKTGAARIALQAEAETDFSLGLVIQVIGITYSDLFRFNSSVTAVVGKVIRVSVYKEEFERDPKAAVKSLTEDIRAALISSTVEVKDVENAELVVKLAKLYRSLGHGVDDRTRIDLVARNVEELRPHFPEKAREVERLLNYYLKLCSSLKLDGSEGLEIRRNHLCLLGLSPFILIGIIFHLIPYCLIDSSGRRLAKHLSQVSSWNISLAFFVFPIWYGLFGIVLLAVGFSVKEITILIVFLVSTGLLARRYFNQFALYFFSILWPGKRTPVDVLRSLRDELVAEIEELRKY